MCWRPTCSTRASPRSEFAASRASCATSRSTSSTSCGCVSCGKCPLRRATTCRPRGDSAASARWFARLARSASGDISQRGGSCPPLTTASGTGGNGPAASTSRAAASIQSISESRLARSSFCGTDSTRLSTWARRPSWPLSRSRSRGCVGSISTAPATSRGKRRANSCACRPPSEWATSRYGGASSSAASSSRRLSTTTVPVCGSTGAPLRPTPKRFQANTRPIASTSG